MENEKCSCAARCDELERKVSWLEAILKVYIDKREKNDLIHKNLMNLKGAFLQSAGYDDFNDFWKDYKETEEEWSEWSNERERQEYYLLLEKNLALQRWTDAVCKDLKISLSDLLCILELSEDEDECSLHKSDNLERISNSKECHYPSIQTFEDFLSKDRNYQKSKSSWEEEWNEGKVQVKGK